MSKVDKRFIKGNKPWTTEPRKTPDGTLSTTFKPQFWRDADSRLGVVKEIKRRHAQLVQDTAADSFQKIALAERASFLLVWMESQEREAIACGEFVNLGTYLQALNTLLGLMRTLGLAKQARDCGTLENHLRKKKQNLVLT